MVGWLVGWLVGCWLLVVGCFSTETPNPPWLQEKVAQLRGVEGGNGSSAATAPEPSPDDAAEKPPTRRVRGKTAAAKKRKGAWPAGPRPLFLG